MEIKLNSRTHFCGDIPVDIKTRKHGKYYYTLYDGEEFFRKYTLNTPSGIIHDLENICEDMSWSKKSNPIIEFIKKSKKFLNEKIYGIAGFGGLTTVFDIGQERVLKISKENPFEYRKYNKRFDIPLLSGVESCGGLYGYVQAKADTENITLKDVLKVKRKMKRAGYMPSNDFGNHRTDQVGRYKGKPYLLDSRCAVKQYDFKTRFAKWFYRHFNTSPTVLVAKVISFDEPIKHVHETPPPNFTKQEAKNLIKKAIKSWFKK